MKGAQGSYGFDGLAGERGLKGPKVKVSFFQHKTFVFFGHISAHKLFMNIYERIWMDNTNNENKNYCITKCMYVQNKET